MTTLHLKHSMNGSPLRLGFLVTPLVLGFFALSLTAQAQISPAPDGGDANQNTAEGDFSLASLTSGHFNTALGFAALDANTNGTANTAIGAGALFNNTADLNTAIGSGALFSNTTGGSFSGSFEDELGPNVAVGAAALISNTTGGANTAVGYAALGREKNFSFSTAVGFKALELTVDGNGNNAFGYKALDNDADGSGNTAIGALALFNNTEGSDNVALGNSAGLNQTMGSGNVYIGEGMEGVAGESNACYIASISGEDAIGGDAVFVTSAGKLGTITTISSARFKDEIKPMDKASEAILALKPVTFRYKKEFDPKRIPQFGLVAEEVEKVNPDLVKRDRDGNLQTVRYDAVNAMLLNEFLKEHRKVQRLEAALAAVNERLKAQDAKIAKVNAKVELTKPASETVLNR